MKTETFADYRKSLDEAVKIFSAKIEGMSDEELTAYINSPGSASTVDRVLSLCSDSTVDRVQTLINLEIPVVENIDQKILEAITAEGCSLNMGAWHTCKTTHCRAGWAIHLAGKEGYALEKKLGDSEMAGRMIYTVSRPGVPYPDFYAPTEVALEDIKKCAAEATAG